MGWRPGYKAIVNQVLPPMHNYLTALLCKGLVALPNGKIHLSDETRLSSVARYECDEGYMLEGRDVTRMCGINGHWSGVAPFCQSTQKKQHTIRGSIN